jgi:hypothetical protein
MLWVHRRPTVHVDTREVRARERDREARYGVSLARRTIDWSDRLLSRRKGQAIVLRYGRVHCTVNPAI